MLILGGFYYCHNSYCQSLFPISTITYNYIQINKASVFSTILQISDLTTD